MTPIGHLAVSYISGRSCRKLSLPAMIIGGVLPDIDFLFLFFSWFNQIHRVITHNLLFLITASFIVMLFAAREKSMIVGISLFLGGCVHLLIDSIMDINPTNGMGVALFWPFNNIFISPFNILHASSSIPGWGDPFNMIRRLIPGMLYEIPFYLISILLLFRRKELSKC